MGQAPVQVAFLSHMWRFLLNQVQTSIGYENAEYPFTIPPFVYLV